MTTTQDAPRRRRYMARRNLLIERGEWQPLTDAGPVRDHVKSLLAARISRDQISRQAGVTQSLLSRLLYGQPYSGAPPTIRIRPDAAARILAVTADPDRVTGTARISPVPATRRLQALTYQGWSVAELAARTGMDEDALRKVRGGARAYIRAETARAVSAVYRDLWDKAPPVCTTPERIAAAKSRAHARRQGWVPPAAWDDDTIADPAATPAEGWQPVSATYRAASELAGDWAELAAQGHTREQAAERLGVTRGTLDRAILRARRRAADPGRPACGADAA